MKKVVKENYTPEKKLAAVTVIYKAKGYKPSKVRLTS